MKTKKFLFVVMLGVTGVITGLEIALAISHTGNHYPNRRMSDTVDIILLFIGIVIWVKYLS